MTLTPKQRAVLQYLREYQEVRGYSPTYREIGLHLGIAPKNARSRVLTLARMGVLSLEERTARSIRMGNKSYNCDSQPEKV